MKMARINLLQLGRVLLEAKPLVGHGNWADWVKSNTSMSVRTAEQYMQAYQQFGLDEEIAELGTSKILKLLPLPEEERKALLDRGDIGAMSAREFDAAIKQAREEALEQGKAEALSEAKAAAEAEIRAQALSEARKTAQAESAKALKDARESWEHCLDAERADAEKRISDAEERVQDAEKRIEDMHSGYAMKLHMMRADPSEFIEGLDIEMMYRTIYYAAVGFLWEIMSEKKPDLDKMEQGYLKLIDHWRKIYLR